MIFSRQAFLLVFTIPNFLRSWYLFICFSPRNFLIRLSKPDSWRSSGVTVISPRETFVGFNKNFVTSVLEFTWVTSGWSCLITLTHMCRGGLINCFYHQVWCWLATASIDYDRFLADDWNIVQTSTLNWSTFYSGIKIVDDCSIYWVVVNWANKKNYNSHIWDKARNKIKCV